MPQPSSNGGKLPKLQNQPAASTAPAPVPGVQPAAQPAAGTAAAPKYSTLFVTIDGLKMRKEPSLKGSLVAKLDLYEQVYFLNKKSEKQEEISLGYEKVTDYWVKVRTKEGKEGWVFGAGVHYYKMKRKGVLE
ncbi:MAG: SH3 domain-containing protein [Saprospiraceae bacterium]|nr:SH3 domain-containing protein [Saprospiraceae bacterium]